MAGYVLTKAADKDLEDIARYTISEWGMDQAESYLGKLERCFQNIGAGRVFLKNVSNRLSHVFVTRCEQHFIFYLAPEKKKRIILAVLHERMDILARLESRFQGL